ncbi:MAG: hypothetical protein A2991_02530 [Candidatus Terrybacteria bacterium RIFCSPLOWO2_01_FULL_58_14]|uniref:Uncharacterized protein n=2 Tax=Candidatus Terryibacteriota TaxID=1817920 RepID=A0A1G2PXA8_9BACT|nr:MAG: hypothetical protein A2682_01295 [Candidatus Terrybacteria bacterium RIFCSPHIGHO2_01_FULL_58_15]OHA52974.1 MAG: hypothetical protein A2991_02530 [Candidatus Terrybacteria bacterium RIFCSPLOWO2_01_FULL_58_14]
MIATGTILIALGFLLAISVQITFGRLMRQQFVAIYARVPTTEEAVQQAWRPIQTLGFPTWLLGRVVQIVGGGALVYAGSLLIA